jgi:hypothetical protein
MKRPEGSWSVYALWLLPTVLATLFAVATGFNGLYGQDSFEYLRYSRSLHGLIAEGIPAGNFFWPVLYPLSGAFLSFLLPDLFSLQLISLVCYGLTGWFLHRILVRIRPGKTAEAKLLVMLFFFLSPFILRYAMTVMSELLAMFLVCASLYSYLAFLNKRRPGHFLLLITAGLAAGFTRYPAFIILAPAIVHAFLIFLRKFHAGYFALTVVMSAILVFAELGLHGRWTTSVFGQPHFTGWSVCNFFRSSFETTDGHLVYRFPNILYVFSNTVNPGFIFAGAILAVMFRRADADNVFLKVLSASFLLYALFLAGLTFQNDRVLLLSFPLVIILFSGPFIRAAGYLSRLRRRYVVLIILLAAVIQAGLFYRAFRPFYGNSRTAKILAEEVRRYPGRTVYTFNAEQALEAYKVGNTVISLYPAKLDSFQVHALVLFNPAAFSTQWKGYNPMTNWETLNTDYRLKTLKILPDGWLLCEIRN